MSADDYDWIRFSGFGTFGVSQSDDNQADYRANIEQSTGVGRTKKRDTGLDSVVAGQIDMQFTPKFTGTAQIVSRRLSDYKSTRPYLEWANLKYDLTEQAYLRAGRFVSPTFMMSESRMVGYTQLTTRPITEVYLLSPITYMNGVDGGYKFSLGSSLVKTRLGFGQLKQEINQVNGTLDFKFDVKSFDTSIENNGSTFRFAYQRLTMTVSNDALDAYDVGINNLVNNNVANAIAVRDIMSHKDVPIDFWVLGYTYDKGKYIFQTEYAYRNMGSDFAQSLAGYYVLGGYRIGQWTPYVSVSRMMHKGSANLPPLDTSLSGGFGGLISAVNEGSTYAIHRSAWSLGVKWDLKENMAVKLQYDRVDKPASSRAEFVNDTPEFFNGHRKIGLISATLDFTF